MDQQSASSHPLINAEFASSLAAGLNNTSNNVNNNQLLSTLQQLSFQNSNFLQSSFGSQLTTDFYNQSGATWQAKMAAMLPVYNFGVR